MTSLCFIPSLCLQPGRILPPGASSLLPWQLRQCFVVRTKLVLKRDGLLPRLTGSVDYPLGSLT